MHEAFACDCVAVAHANLAAAAPPHNPGFQTVVFPGSPGYAPYPSAQVHTCTSARTYSWGNHVKGQCGNRLRGGGATAAILAWTAGAALRDLVSDRAVTLRNVVRLTLHALAGHEAELDEAELPPETATTVPAFGFENRSLAWSLQLHDQVFCVLRSVENKGS